MRKGDLLTDNFLEILLAVIGLVLVGYVAYQIYQVTVNQDVTIAKKMLDSLEAKINLLNVGEEGEYTLKGPCKEAGKCDWYLMGWGKTDLHRPEKCYFKSCMCACKGTPTGFSSGISPELTSGIIRVCSSDNPGKDFSSSSYVDVGYCDQEYTRCWFDTRSISSSSPSLTGEIKTYVACVSGTSNRGVLLPEPKPGLLPLCQTAGYCRFFDEEDFTVGSNYFTGGSIPNPQYALGERSGLSGPLISGNVPGEGVRLEPLNLLNVHKTAEGVTIKSV